MVHISVVMPAFNAGRFISCALQSIEAQSFRVDEVIVIDDGSADDTAATVESWSDRLPVVLLRNDRNRGISASLRRGVEASRGDWILRLDADDRWLPQHAQALVEAASQSPSAVLVTASASLVDESGHPLGLALAPNDATVRARLMWDNPLIHSASGFLRSAYLNVGGYREDVRWEDYDLWIRLLEVGTLGTSGLPSVEYTVAGHSLSRVKRSVSIAARWHCQKAAVRKFWQRHPVSAVRSTTLGALRFAASSWI